MSNLKTKRSEPWGEVYYDKSTDQFSAIVRNADIPLVPATPIGIGWVIIGACNLKCVHCYGNAEELPKVAVSTSEAMKIVQRLVEANIMRVVISGGEPLLRDDIYDIINALVDNGISVVLGTNGSFIEKEHVCKLRVCTRVEISLDAANQDLNNRIRPSRQRSGNAWSETLRSIKLCLKAGVNVRVLTAINSSNQDQIVEMSQVISELGVTDWAISWTVPAGRAKAIYELLEPDLDTVEAGVEEARKANPSLAIRYSSYAPTFSRFYCLILPDGQLATEDIELGAKVSFGSIVERPVIEYWNGNNYNLEEHFEKWVGNRVRRE